MVVPWLQPLRGNQHRPSRWVRIQVRIRAALPKQTSESLESFTDATKELAQPRQFSLLERGPNQTADQRLETLTRRPVCRFRCAAWCIQHYGFHGTLRLQQVPTVVQLEREIHQQYRLRLPPPGGSSLLRAVDPPAAAPLTTPSATGAADNPAASGNGNAAGTGDS